MNIDEIKESILKHKEKLGKLRNKEKFFALACRRIYETWRHKQVMKARK